MNEVAIRVGIKKGTIPKDSSAGLDGFSSSFFITY